MYKQHSGTDAGLERTSLSLMDQQHRFVMIDVETKPRVIVGIPAGRTSPEQTVRYQLHNHLSSAALELNESAQVISYEEYHPYGTTAFQAKNAGIKAVAKRYRYTGMERDEESGLEYHSARYYLPWLGRWGSGDPIGIKDGVNIYIYAKGNPLLFKDEKGTETTPPPPQIHLIEQFTLQTRATRTSFSQEANIRLYVRNIALMWGENPSDYQAGHHPATPQWSTPPGGVQWLGPQHRLANLAQSAQEAADRRAATAIPGAYFRTDRTHTGAPIPNPPPTVLSPDLRSVITWTPSPSTPAPAISLSTTSPGTTSRLGAGPVQLSFPFAQQASPQLAFDFNRPRVPAPPASIPTPSTPRVQLSFDFDSPTSTPAPRSSPTVSRGPGAGTAVGTMLIPGAAEAVVTTEALVPLAAQAGLPRLMAAAASGARAPGPGLVGGAVGAPAGVVAESVARDAGMSEAASTGIGAGTAVVTGAGVAMGVAAVGAVIVSAPVTVPLLAGAAIVGGLTAGFGYLMSRAMR